MDTYLSTYIYIYTYIHIRIYIYIYAYIQSNTKRGDPGRRRLRLLAARRGPVILYYSTF